MLERPYMALALILDNGLWQARGRATRIGTVTTRNVNSLDTARGRERRMTRAREARRRGEATGGGRAWINGREVGGANARFAHLARSHD